MSPSLHTRVRRRLVPVAALLALAPAVAACGASDEAPSSSGTSSAGADFPVTVTGDDGELTLDEQPQNIVSMSPTATEMLFAIGAGDQVEAVDDNSNYPEDVPTTELSSFTPNAEAIAGYDPDLVVLSDDINGVVDALDALSIPTLLLGAAEDLEDSYAQIETLGDATGHAAEADEVVAGMQERIADAVDAVADRAEGLTVYHELGPELYSAGSSTFIGSVYSLFGMENIADEAADAAGGYPQLSAEYIVDAQPDLIVLADTICCGQTAATVAERPGFGTLTAVQEGRVLEASDDVASRWGPRIADFAESVAGTLQD